MSEENIKFRVMRATDKERVIKFYIENFYRDEPVFGSQPKLIPGARDVADMAECIYGGTSILCYRNTAEGKEEMLGGLLSIGRDSSYIDDLFKAASSLDNTKYGHYLKMLAVVHRKADICNRYGVDKIFFTFMACVKPQSRGQNICKRLGEESMALARNLGFAVYTSDCTSNYTARISESLQMDHLNTLMYEDFLDDNKKPYFVVPGPHKAVRTYAVRLRSRSHM